MGHEGQSDEALAERARAGDEVALRLLVERYLRPSLAVAREFTATLAAPAGSHGTVRKRGAVRRDPITDRSGPPEGGGEAGTVPGRPGRTWLTVTVVGMNADDSPDRLGRVLELCPGVVAAEVAPPRGTVTVAYDPRTADVAMLLRLTAMVGTRGRGRVTSVSVTASCRHPAHRPLPSPAVPPRDSYVGAPSPTITPAATRPRCRTSPTDSGACRG